MELISDLHIHSRFARGCSPRMGIREMAKEAKVKGINLVGTGDFTHPKYFEEIKKECGKENDSESDFLVCDGTYFIPTTEINNTYTSDDGKKRRIHNLIVMPDLEICSQFNDEIGKKSKLGVDGRPWVKMGLAETVEVLNSISKNSLFIPAHAWTPWFGIFGAKGGFDSLKEAFGDKVKSIYAIETGLSSDPAMNWRCSWLDRVSLVSFSDAHSPEKLGREASVLELKKPEYAEFFNAIKNKEGGKLKKTIEFFPQEGKYYSDGCKNCELRTTPAETKKFNGRCPKCGRKITKGVLGRIDELADREEGIKPALSAPYSSIVPLRDLVAMAIGKGVASDAVGQAYSALTGKFGGEFEVLLNLDVGKIEKMAEIRKEYALAVANSILRMREGKLHIEPGYDGKFGVVGL